MTFAQGGGEVLLSASSLRRGACLPAIDLTERGEVASVRICAFAAGKVPAAAAEQMVAAGERAVRVSFAAVSSPHIALPHVAWDGDELTRMSNCCGFLLTASVTAAEALRPGGGGTHAM